MTTRDDDAFEDFRALVDEGKLCPSCTARSTAKFFHDGEAYHCPVCRLRFNSWIRQPFPLLPSSIIGSDR